MTGIAIILGVAILIGYPCHRWAQRRQREWDHHCNTIVRDDPHVVAFRRRAAR